MSTDGSQPAHPQNDELADFRRGTNIRSYGIIKTIMGLRVVDKLPLRVRCECAITSCEEIIEISLRQRRDLRRNYPVGFIVAPQHTSARDNLLYKSDIYWVVEKPQYSEKVTDL